MVASLVGDPARANMLTALMTGRALTASELAHQAGITPQTASSHLAKLEAGGLIEPEKQGRHRYYRLSSPAVARMLEGISALIATQGPGRYRPASKVDDELRTGRLCYDHLAGRLGVALADALVGKDCIQISEDGGVVTAMGERFFADLQIDLSSVARQRRHFCRPCLDWSERRHHLAGSLGAALATRCFDLGWIERTKRDRAIAVTRKGYEGLSARFGISAETLRLPKEAVLRAG